MLVDSKKILGLRDVALLTFVSNFGVRWFAVAAGVGFSSVSYWIIGALMLGIPFAFIAAELSRLYPEEGGIYAWTRNTLGEKNGFIVAWLYFVNNIFYYPAILIFLATNFSYFIGKPALANNSIFICVVVLVAFWLVVLMSLFGLKKNKILTEYGGVAGSIVPALLIIVLGIGFLIWRKHSATPFHWNALLPNLNVAHSLSNLTMLMFAITGVEIIPTFANAVKNPKRDLYIGLLVGAFALIIFYILGTIALNILLSPSEIHNTSGLIDAFQLAFLKLHMPWMTRGVAFLLVFAELAVVSIWLIAPITMFFKCTPEGLLPPWFHRTNKSGAPTNAILFVGLLVTVILLATNLLPAVNDMYQVLVLISVVLVFIPYLFLMVVYVKNLHRISGNQYLHGVFVLVVTLSLLMGIIFSFALPSDIKTQHAKIIYELELFFGPLFFILMGYAIYFFRKHKFK